MRVKPYIRNQRFRVIESAVAVITDYVPDIGLTYPTALQVVVIAKADTPAATDAMTINGHAFGAPELTAGAVWKFDYFGKGSIAICNAAYDLGVNIGLGRYHKLEASTPPVTVARMTENGVARLLENSTPRILE